MGGSFSWVGEDIWMAVLAGRVRIFGCSFSWLGKDIWVAILAGWVRIFGWQFWLGG